MLSENSGVHRDFNSQSGSSLGSVRVHSFTLSYTPESMRRDSLASLLAHNLCLGCEPKARVAIKELVKKFLCYGDDGMNVFQRGKTRVTVHYVVHHTNLVT